jgi:hypothetical protein
MCTAFSILTLRLTIFVQNEGSILSKQGDTDKKLTRTGLIVLVL